MDLSIKILNKLNEVRAELSSQDEVRLVFKEEYNEGDKIVIETSKANTYLIVQVDDAMDKSFVYITENKVEYSIPFGEKKIAMSPKTFYGNRHLLFVRLARKEEVDVYKNLACSAIDQQNMVGLYPHASANIETRGEAVFSASNAINGNCQNKSHGKWPDESWGIGMRDDAQLKVEFGRTVLVDKIHLYTRADFPHDNWWTSVTFNFSDGSRVVAPLEKSDKAHVITFDEREIEWITFDNLIKADDPSPFPALSQIEVYGKEIL